MKQYKIGDFVVINSGFYKGEVGQIGAIYNKTGKVIVKGINFKFKHMKPRFKNEIGDIKRFEAPIHYSNIKLLLN